jgi:dihydrodipicolinate synthase/N-acetylneuraminate lyase
VTKRDSVPWRGYWPASPTPFTAAGELDLPALQETIRLYIDHGVHGILVNGTTGEWWAQTISERREVARAAVEAAAGSVPVLVGVTHFVPDQAASLAESAADSGADGVLSTVPPYVHPTGREILAWYRALSERSPLPVMIYNWPRGVGVDLSVDLLAELVQLDNVVAVKDSSGDELKTLVALERLGGEVRFFARFISRRGLAVLQEIGGDGNIDGGGIGAIFGAGYYDAVWSGEMATARDLAARYQSVSEALVHPDYSGRFGSPVAQVKAVMRLLGQPGGHVRGPLLDIPDSVAREAVQGKLAAAGLLAELAARRPGSVPRGRATAAGR